MSTRLPAVFKHPLHALLRALWLSGEISLVAARYLIEWQRSIWLTSTRSVVTRYHLIKTEDLF